MYACGCARALALALRCISLPGTVHVESHGFEYCVQVHAAKFDFTARDYSSSDCPWWPCTSSRDDSTSNDDVESNAQPAHAQMGYLPNSVTRIVQTASMIGAKIRNCIACEQTRDMLLHSGFIQRRLSADLAALEQASPHLQFGGARGSPSFRAF